MKTPSMHGSVWLESPMPECAPLSGDVACDVCVIGGGMAGLLVAERLTREGLSVTVLESGSLAGGETSRTTAHFVTALDDRYTRLRQLHGQRGARLVAESQVAAIDHVETLIDRLEIDCGWERLDGYLVVNERHADKRDELLEEELVAAIDAELSVERVDRLPAPWPVELGPAIRFPRQAQAHPRQLLRGVAQHLADNGVRLHERTRATSVRGGNEPAVETDVGYMVQCSHVVVATNTPVNNFVAVHTKQAGYQTYVSAFAAPPGALPPLLLWDGLWRDDTAYRYLRLLPQGAGDGGDLLIVGGEDHKTGQGPERDTPFRNIEAWVARHFPMCGRAVRRWSGEVMEPADAIGYIGRDAGGRRNVFVVTGDSGTGMTNSAIAAILIPELIMGRSHAWETLYDPSRKIGLHALGTYVRENVNTFAQYGDWLTRGDVPDEDSIRPGEGAVIVDGLRHVAVFKDDQGRCTRLSAVCPHLAGVVRWNNQEKTWDCPCHASRFDRFGHVMHGPANRDLHRAEDSRRSEAPTRREAL